MSGPGETVEAATSPIEEVIATSRRLDIARRVLREASEDRNIAERDFRTSWRALSDEDKELAGIHSEVIEQFDKLTGRST